MRIIITESQYKLITERQDDKNIQETNDIYRLFITKFKNRDFKQYTNTYDTWLEMTLDTEYGELRITLTNEEQRNRDLGQYIRNDNGKTIPKIIMYKCDFEFERKKIVNIKRFNTQVFRHEMVHFIDDKKNRKLPKRRNTTPEEWNNDTHEINAQFISIMKVITSKKDYVLPDTFEGFFKSYKNYDIITARQFSKLTDKNRKSFINRMYQYYTYLKDKQREETK